jgi:ribA/ribD-fused uncharacterized protein
VSRVHAAQLLAALQAQDEGDYLFFWKAVPKRGYLSQWWRSPFTVDGIEYRTAEHWMMAEKARLFGDDEARSAILATEEPDHVKKLGQTVRDFDDATWVAHRYEIVVAGNLAKFSSNADLREYLLSTGRSILVEASPYDRIWGIGLADDDPRAHRPASWRGLNLLGFALMDVRAQLAA